MASYQEQAELKRDRNFVRRVRQACVAHALEILSSADDDNNYERYQARASLARRFVNSPESAIDALMPAVCASLPPGANSNMNDNAIDALVSAHWNKFCGWNPSAPAAPDPVA